MKRNKRQRLSEQDTGIYSTGIPKEEEEEELEVEFGVGEDIPIDPVAQMTTQLSVDRPPIEDEDFIPGTLEQLSNSAKALAQLVPNDQFEWYYKQLHKLLDKAVDRSAYDEEEEVEPVRSPEEREQEMQEESIRRIIRKSLLEVLSDEFSDEDATEWESFRYGSEPAAPAAPAPEASDAVSLEDLADQFGYSGAPGIRQEINRLTDRMEYFSTKVSKEDLDALLGFAVGEYIDTLGETGVLDEEDLDDLRSAPSMVKDMDSFRFFFVSAFVLPAWKDVARDANKKVKSAIEDLGVPKEIQQTIFNQVSGSTKRDTGLIRKKLLKLVNAGKISSDELDEVESKIHSAMAMLSSMSELSDDLVEKALQKWQGMTQKKRAAIIQQAMDQTAEFQGE